MADQLVGTNSLARERQRGAAESSLEFTSMRFHRTILIFLTVGASLAPAVAPPATDSPALRDLLKQLTDADFERWKAASKKLEDFGEAALPGLSRLARSSDDVDVRLRALVIARAIDAKFWGQVRAFGLGAAHKVAPPFGGYWINRVAFTPDGKYCVAGGGGLILFELKTGKEVGRVLEFGGARPGLAMARDGKHCLTGHSAFPDVHLVAIPSLKVAQTFKGHSGGIWGVALSADGTRAASTGADQFLIIWDVKTGKLLKRIKGVPTGMRSVAFSPDGKRVAVGHFAAKIGPDLRVWDLESSKMTASFTAHTSDIVAVAFTPDGRSILSASLDGTLALWDLKTEKLRVRMKHHGGAIYDAALSPDSKRALTAGMGDRAARLWDLEKGKLIRVFDGHLGSVLGVAFDADGRRALSCDSVTCIRLWKVGRK
jgi:hypothetical protein